MRRNVLRGLFLMAALFWLGSQSAANAGGFERLFDGKTLNGWFLRGGVGRGYIVRDGLLVCPADGGGDLLTNKTYRDFVLRFEYKLDKAGNNGIGLRTPTEGDFAYTGMESQILDDDSPDYAHLEPGQYHGSIYKVVAAKRGATKPAGQWNKEEITARGRRIKVVLNGKTIVDADLNAVTDPAIIAEHPGIFRDSGHIALLGHGPSEVVFRHLAIQDISSGERDNTPPPGFKALFNGRNLDGWQGLVADPPTRAKMNTADLILAEKKATLEAKKHWRAGGGAITYDGKNNNLGTVRNYHNFEMLVDWKIPPHGDSGIYLRGSPQVQIWEDAPPVAATIGSGGLYNNQKNPSNPTKKADKPVGEWNRFRIIMIGEKVTVFLNGELVTWNVPMENYWERDKPIYATGPIELQHHGDTLSFKNIYIRELP